MSFTNEWSFNFFKGSISLSKIANSHKFSFKTFSQHIQPNLPEFSYFPHGQQSRLSVHHPKFRQMPASLGLFRPKTGPKSKHLLTEKSQPQYTIALTAQDKPCLPQNNQSQKVLSSPHKHSESKSANRFL